LIGPAESGGYDIRYRVPAEHFSMLKLRFIVVLLAAAICAPRIAAAADPEGCDRCAGS